MAVAPLIVPFVALVLSSSACQNPKPSRQDTTAIRAADTTRHMLPADSRALVLRARELDRADSLEAARAAYEQAAEKLPQISDWLYLRAAGVTADSAARILLEAAPDVGAIASGGPTPSPGASGLRGSIRATAAGCEARCSETTHQPAGRRRVELRRAGSAVVHSDSTPRLPVRPSIFRQGFYATTPPRAYHRSRRSNPIAGSRRNSNAKAGNGTRRCLRKHCTAQCCSAETFEEAANQFTKVRTPPRLAAAAQYQRARAQIALGNTEAGRATLRSITTAYPTDTSAASALLLLADLATDENRDRDARQTLTALLKRFPTGRHAANARFRSGMIAYIQGDRKAAAAEFDSLVSRDPNSVEALGAAYWAGRSYAALGDKTQVPRGGARLSQGSASYYAVMAAKAWTRP